MKSQAARIQSQSKVIHKSRCFPNKVKVRKYRKEIGVLKGKVLREEGTAEQKKKALGEEAAEKDAAYKDNES